MWELDHKEGWAPKNWCFRTVVLEKSLKSPLNLKEIKPVNPKGNQSWIFIGRTNAEWSSNPLATWCEEPSHWKRPWCWERLKTEGEGGWQDEMFGWHHWLNRPEMSKLMASGPITSLEIDGQTVSDFILGAPKSLQMVTTAMKLKDAYSLEGKLWPT